MMCLRGQNGSEKSNELEKRTVCKLPGGQCIAVKCIGIKSEVGGMLGVTGKCSMEVAFPDTSPQDVHRISAVLDRNLVFCVIANRILGRTFKPRRKEVFGGW